MSHNLTPDEVTASPGKTTRTRLEVKMRIEPAFVIAVGAALLAGGIAYAAAKRPFEAIALTGALADTLRKKAPPQVAWWERLLSRLSFSAQALIPTF